MIERYFVQAMRTYHGDLGTVITASGISITIWVIVVLALLGSLLKPLITRFRKKQATVAATARDSE